MLSLDGIPGAVRIMVRHVDMGRSIWFGEAQNGAKKGSEFVLTRMGSIFGLAWDGVGSGEG